MTIIARVKQWARSIRRDVVAVYFAARDPRTPMIVRCFAVLIAAYALSPIDLIPDFIPIIGYLDDLVVAPLGLLLVLRFLPHEVLVESREKASSLLVRPTNYAAAASMIGIWLLCIVLLFHQWWSGT